MKLPPDVDALLGVPFRRGGRDYRTGLDCWGLAMARAALEGRRVPDLGELADAALQEVDVPPAGAVAVGGGALEAGDVLPLPGADVLTHCVVVDLPGYVLEVAPGIPVRRFPISRLAHAGHGWRWPRC